MNHFEFTKWRKSTKSEPSNNCVEVGVAGNDAIGLRDTKDDGQGPTLAFTRMQWLAFLDNVDRLAFGVSDPVTMTLLPDNGVHIAYTAAPEYGVAFTSDEWIAFRAGVALGEFTHATLAGAA